MALISPESLERVKQAADIVEVISAHTDLRRAGARWTGLCPFHDERTPSFSVDAQEKLYHCFGCGVGGDVIKFVEEKEGLGFAEAVELLADRYGVELEREQEDPRAEARRQQRRRLEQLLDRTAAFYASYLWESKEAGEGARVPGRARPGRGGAARLRRRLRAQRLGQDPGPRPAGRLQRRRAARRRPGPAGRDGGEYDRFRSRIMFPIRDRRGRTLGFGGRAMRADQGAKYVNTAETDFFHKSQLLYGIDLAEGGDRQGGPGGRGRGLHRRAALHQAGIEEAVAVMGTAITGEQVATLSGMVEEVVLALDADSAGQEAMLRAQRVAAGRKMRLRVAAMPAGEDPAEMMAGRGRAGALPRAGRRGGGAARLPGRAGARRHRRRLAGRARPRAGRGGAGAGGDGGDGQPRRPGPPGGRAARPRAGDGDGPGGRGAARPAAARAGAERAPRRAPPRRRRAAPRS